MPSPEPCGTCRARCGPVNAGPCPGPWKRFGTQELSRGGRGSISAGKSEGSGLLRPVEALHRTWSSGCPPALCAAILGSEIPRYKLGSKQQSESIDLARGHLSAMDPMGEVRLRHDSFASQPSSRRGTPDLRLPARNPFATPVASIRGSLRSDGGRITGSAASCEMRNSRSLLRALC